MMRVGLALGGGAARALAHIGVLEVLEENNIFVDCIAGTSMGAILGGIYSLGFSPSEIEARAVSMLPKEKKNILKRNYSTESLYSTEHIHKKLFSFFQDKTFQDLKIPFSAVAVDLISGKKVVFNSGRLIDAVEASSRIPLIYPPKKIGDMVLVDGAVLCPVPTDVVKEQCDFTISVPVAFYNKEKHPNHYLKMLNVFDRSLALLINRLTEVELINSKPDFIIPLDDVAVFDGSEYDRAKEIIAIGRLTAERYVEDLKKRISLFKEGIK